MPKPRPATRHTLARDEILAAMDIPGRPLQWRNIIRLCARHLFDKRADMHLAAQLMDLDAAEILIDKMVKDGELVARTNREWDAVLVRDATEPRDVVCYTTKAHADAIDAAVLERQQARAEAEAKDRLAAEYPERFQALTTECLAALTAPADAK